MSGSHFASTPSKAAFSCAAVATSLTRSPTRTPSIPPFRNLALAKPSTQRTRPLSSSLGRVHTHAAWPAHAAQLIRRPSTNSATCSPPSAQASTGGHAPALTEGLSDASPEMSTSPPRRTCTPADVAAPPSAAATAAFHSPSRSTRPSKASGAAPPRSASPPMARSSARRAAPGGGFLISTLPTSGSSIAAPSSTSLIVARFLGGARRAHPELEGATAHLELRRRALAVLEAHLRRRRRAALADERGTGAVPPSVTTFQSPSSGGSSASDSTRRKISLVLVELVLVGDVPPRRVVADRVPQQPELPASCTYLGALVLYINGVHAVRLLGAGAATVTFLSTSSDGARVAAPPPSRALRRHPRRARAGSTTC